jgi:hypothetical protein
MCFWRNGSHFLGYTVSAVGTRPLEEKVAAINRFQQPVFVKDLRRFLGMLNFYRRFIPQVASIQAPSRSVRWSQGQRITTGGLDTHHGPSFRGLQG